MIRYAGRGHIELTSGRVDRLGRIALGCKEVAIKIAFFRALVLAVIRAGSVHTAKKRL